MVVYKWLVVVSFVVIWGLFALVMDFREVMWTSPPEWAHCAPPPPPPSPFLAASLVHLGHVACLDREPGGGGSTGECKEGENMAVHCNKE